MRRRTLLAAGVLAVVGLLAAGAFTAGRLLGSAQAGAGEPTLTLSTGKGPAVGVEWVPDERAPAEEPDVAGAFDHRVDNTLYVEETTDEGFVLRRDSSGALALSNGTGRVREVVVTAETAVYVDLTLSQVHKAAAEGTLRQVLEPGSIDEIGELSYVCAWGEQRGDRLVASVLIYLRPPVIER